MAVNKLPETQADLCAKQRSFALLAGMACAVRLIYSAAVYLQNTGNAAWIQALGGMLLALPSLYLLAGEIKLSGSIPPALNKLKRFACALYIPFFSFDSASWVFSLAESSSYTTFTEYSLLVLFLAALIVSAIIASRGANACGGYARGALYVSLLFIGLAMFWQTMEMHPIWLTPVLGGGIGTIARGSVLCGGYASLYTAGIWIFLQIENAVIEKEVLRRVKRALPVSGIAAMVFLLFYGMLSPNLPYAPHIRSFALERLLTGGGRSTSVHFPSLVSWYTMLLVAAIYSLFCSASCIRLLFPKRSFSFCCIISALLSIVWTPVRMFWKHGEDLLVFANIIVVTTVSLALYVQAHFIGRRRKDEKD